MYCVDSDIYYVVHKLCNFAILSLNAIKTFKSPKFRATKPVNVYCNLCDEVTTKSGTPSPRWLLFRQLLFFRATWWSCSFRVVSLWQENCSTSRLSAQGDMHCGRSEPRPSVSGSNPVVSSARCRLLLKPRSHYTVSIPETEADCRWRQPSRLKHVLNHELWLGRSEFFENSKLYNQTTWSGLMKKITTAHSELRKVLFLAPSVCDVLFLHAISREPLNGFALKHGRRVWFLVRTRLKVKVKG